MAYGLKYILRYETERNKTDFRVKIYAKDYVGSVSYKKIGAGRVVLNKESDGKICGTSLDFSIQADVDAEYVDFFNNDNKAHLVVLEMYHFDIWQGYIVSDQYSEPYIAAPYDVQVMSTDGLGLLKSEDFELTGIVSRFDAIRYCLDKIGLGLGYYMNVDYYETRMDASTHNMLAQLYFDCSIFSEKNCYEVLEALLPEGVTITQEAGRWLIERVSDIGKPRWHFYNDGTAEGVPSTQSVYQLSKIGAGHMFPVGALIRNFEPAWKNCTIKQNYGKKESFFKNYDFTNGITDWTENGGTGFLKHIDLNNGTFGLIQGKQLTASKYVSQSVKVKTSDVVIFSFDYSIIAHSSSESLPGLTPLSGDILFKLKLVGNSGTTYYHNQKEWITTDYTNKIEKVSSDVTLDSVDFKSFKIIGSKLPENGTVTFIIYQLVYTFSTTGKYFAGIALKEVLFYTQNIALYSDTEETKVNIANNATENGKVIELMPVDLPDYDNAEMYFRNGNLLSISGEYVPAKLWTTGAVRYINYLAAFIGAQYGNPKSVLKGQLSGVGLGLNVCIQHVYDNNRKYVVQSGSWHIIDDYIDVTLIEMIASETSGITVPAPFNPNESYEQYPDLLDFTSIGNEGSYTKNIDGSFEVFIPGYANPLVVSRKETVTPFLLSPDAGTPQFSITSTIETNIDGNANKINISTGKLISHHFNALRRDEIKLLQ